MLVKLTPSLLYAGKARSLSISRVESWCPIGCLPNGRPLRVDNSLALQISDLGTNGIEWQILMSWVWRILTNCFEFTAANLRPGPNVIKLLSPWFTNFRSKLQCLFPVNFSRPSQTNTFSVVNYWQKSFITLVHGRKNKFERRKSYKMPDTSKCLPFTTAAKKDCIVHAPGIIMRRFHGLKEVKCKFSFLTGNRWPMNRK
jgi:hypothetical protein